jgi:hypothetical protein
MANILFFKCKIRLFFFFGGVKFRQNSDIKKIKIKTLL